MFEILQLPFVQRGLMEIALLAVGTGLMGTWIILRSQAFFTHAVSTATFPGLVLAVGLGFAPLLGAFGIALLVAIGVAFMSRKQIGSQDSAIALVLVAALAIGVILASDVFATQASVEQLLFGSLLLIDSGDQLIALGLSAAALAATAIFGTRWLATGFESGASRYDLLLLGLIALASVAVLHAMGALLAGALLVIPAATTRLFFDRMLPWQLATVALVLIEGSAGLILSVELNAPPGATIAVVGGGVFLIAALARQYRHALPARAVPLGLMGLTLLLLAGCGSSDDTGDRPKVVASTTIVADMTRQVAGPDFDVRQVLKSNSDPHEYEPRPEDVKAIAGADLILSSGLGLDEFMDDAVKSSGTKAEFAEVGDAVRHPLKGDVEEHAEGEHDHGDVEEHAEGEHDHGDLDPHWWQNPRNAELVVSEIARRLKAISPERSGDIDRRAAQYKARIARLDRAIASCIAKVPAAQRKLVTSHDAFGYYADRYGIKVVGTVIPATTTLAQPNAGDLAELSRTVRREKVKAIFPEQALNKRLTDAIATQTGARSDLVLYGDALGPEGSAGDTYLKILATNTERIATGFSGGARHCSVSP